MTGACAATTKGATRRFKKNLGATETRKLRQELRIARLPAGEPVVASL